jgi:hypothetical protein
MTKRLIVAAIKGCFNIWLKKCGYKDMDLSKRAGPNKLITDLEEFSNGKQDRQ